MISKKECGLNPVVQESDDWVDDLEENGQQATNVEVGGIQCKATKTILLCPGMVELTVADCNNPIYIITLVFSRENTKETCSRFHSDDVFEKRISKIKCRGAWLREFISAEALNFRSS